MKQLIVIVCCLVSVSTKAQSINPNHFYGTWQLDKYSDEEQYYHPPKKEAGDFITLNKDMTFTTVSEGEKTEGTWLYNTNGTYIELQKKSDQKEKWVIHFLSTKSMVVTYDTDAYRIWEVHFVKKKHKKQ